MKLHSPAKSHLLVFGYILLISCNSVHLNEKIIKTGGIVVKWYQVSEITTIHDFIDLERDGRKHNILEANINGVTDVTIDTDTVIIKADHRIVLYDLTAFKQRTYIRLDTSYVHYQ